MRPPLAQADAVSAVVALLSLALTIAAHLAGQREHGARNRPAIFDAWRCVALFGLWSTLIFLSSVLDPRLYVDDYQEIGLRPVALWGGAIGVALLYTVQRVRERPAIRPVVAATAHPCLPCGGTIPAATSGQGAPTFN